MNQPGNIDKRIVLICVLESDVPTGITLPPGLTKQACPGCSRMVMVSASSVPLLRSDRGYALCQDCVTALQAMSGKSYFYAMTPEQLDELAAWRRQEAERN
jgi:hypothetical protein